MGTQTLEAHKLDFKENENYCFLMISQGFPRRVASPGGFWAGCGFIGFDLHYVVGTWADPPEPRKLKTPRNTPRGGVRKHVFLFLVSGGCFLLFVFDFLMCNTFKENDICCNIFPILYFCIFCVEVGGDNFETK